MEIKTRNVFIDKEDSIHLTELYEEIDSFEVERPQVERHTIDIQKALKRCEHDSFIVPLTLVAKLFLFEVDSKGNLRLKDDQPPYVSLGKAAVSGS
jgi:hypothetical protein